MLDEKSVERGLQILRMICRKELIREEISSGKYMN